MKLGLFLSLR